MRFSIRDLLLVTVIVALAVGWGVDRSALAKSTREMEKELLRFRQYEELEKMQAVWPPTNGRHSLPGPSAPARSPATE